MQEDDTDFEQPSQPQRRDWYKNDVFPIKADRDFISSPIGKPFNSFYIDLDHEESSRTPRHDIYKTNVIPSMSHNNISSPTRIMMG
ncbi:unnamed protein product, partial [Larinioides sclopetarius]